jgi:membrane protein YqaA with SNARE-associated domain
VTVNGTLPVTVVRKIYKNIPFTAFIPVNFLPGLFTSLGLGFLYFISAIPAATALGIPVWVAAIAASLGYSVGGAIILVLGAPFQKWLRQKWNYSPNPKKLIWRVFNRYGPMGLGLLAPITIGPQFGTLLLLTLGIQPRKVFFAISLGVIPWSILLAGLVKTGSHCLEYFK